VRYLAAPRPDVLEFYHLPIAATSPSEAADVWRTASAPTPATGRMPAPSAQLQSPESPRGNRRVRLGRPPRIVTRTARTVYGGRGVGRRRCAGRDEIPPEARSRERRIAHPRAEPRGCLPRLGSLGCTEQCSPFAVVLQPEFEEAATRPLKQRERSGAYGTRLRRVSLGPPGVREGRSTARMREGGEMLSVFRIVVARAVGVVL
jgi:hypothetical protein